MADGNDLSALTKPNFVRAPPARMLQSERRQRSVGVHDEQRGYASLPEMPNNSQQLEGDCFYASNRNTSRAVLTSYDHPAKVVRIGKKEVRVNLAMRAVSIKAHGDFNTAGLVSQKSAITLMYAYCLESSEMKRFTLYLCLAHA